MNATLLLLVLCFFAGLGFAVVRLLLAGKISNFWLDVISVLVAFLIFASRSFLGIPLS